MLEEDGQAPCHAHNKAPLHNGRRRTPTRGKVNSLNALRALMAFPRIKVVPNLPQTNMMHVFIKGEREAREAAVLAVARETGVWLCSWFAPTALPQYQKFELVVGEATLDLPFEEIDALFHALLGKAGAA